MVMQWAIDSKAGTDDPLVNPFDDPAILREWEACAKWCAKHGYTGKQGDQLPTLISSRIHELINFYGDDFQAAVYNEAYALACAE